MPTPENWLAKHLPPAPASDATAVTPGGTGDPMSRLIAALGDRVHSSITSPSTLPSIADITSPNKDVQRAAFMKMLPLVMSATGGLSEAPEMLAIEHYSPKPGLHTLDPEFAGTGPVRGAERTRPRDPAVHVYDSGIDRAEPDFAKMYRYTGQIPKDKVYDISNDDAGLISAFQKRRGYLDPSEMETMLKKKGYIALRASDGPNPETVKVFGKIKVEPAMPRTIKGRTFGIPQPINSVVSDAMNTRRSDMLSALKTPETADKLHALLNGEGGFTFDPNTGKSVLKGYAVGAGNELGNVLRKPVKDLTPGHIEDWLAANNKKFAPGTVLGGWVDKADGTAYLEPSTLVKTLKEAKKLGLSRGEKAIADLSKFAKGLDGEIRF